MDIDCPAAGDGEDERMSLESRESRDDGCGSADMVGIMSVKCQVCLDDCSVLKVISCTTEAEANDMDLDGGEPRHHICNDCLEHMVQSWSSRDARDLSINRVGGRLQCQVTGCNGFFDDQRVASHTTPAVFRAYVENRMRIAAHNKGAECESEFQARLGHELAVLDEGATVARHIHRLVGEVLEDVIATKCPGCQQHFDGFVGCFALNCDGYVNGVGRVGCDAHFCGWCFALFKDENAAHEHLLGNHCKEVIPVRRRSRQFKGRLYGSVIDYVTSIKARPARMPRAPACLAPPFIPFFLSNASSLPVQERRMRLLRAYLAKLETPVRAALLAELKPHLRGVLPSYYFASIYPRADPAEGHSEGEASDGDGAEPSL